jgi:tripartite-type tricarboxylate transporter receptor subunit TctC
MFKKILMAITIACFSMSTMAQTAQWTPTKTIEITVGFPPGGAADAIGRLVAKMFTDNGWNTIVVNRPGASTTIAANHVAQQKPDGYNLFLGGLGFLDANLAAGDSALGINYNENSFTDIITFAYGSLTLIVDKDLPINNYEEFKQYVRKNPEKFNLGYWNQYAANVFYKWAELEKLPKPQIIIYKGTAPMMQDLFAKQIPFAFDTWTAASNLYETDRVKVIAVLDREGLAFIKKTAPKNKDTKQLVSLAQRHPELDIVIWNGLVGPAGMPKEIVNEMNAVLNRAFKDPKYAADIEFLKVPVKGGTPEYLKQTHERLLSSFRKINAEVK